jgi:hypothetical protein
MVPTNQQSAGVFVCLKRILVFVFSAASRVV